MAFHFNKKEVDLDLLEEEKSKWVDKHTFNGVSVE